MQIGHGTIQRDTHHWLLAGGGGGNHSYTGVGEKCLNCAKEKIVV